MEKVKKSVVSKVRGGREELWLFRQAAADAQRACVKTSDTVVHGPAAEVTRSSTRIRTQRSFPGGSSLSR